MRFLGKRSLMILVLSSLAAMTAACGGSKHDANAPTNDAARGGSMSPDQTSAAPAAAAEPAAKPTAPVNETAQASTKDDGSDIVPPFPSAGAKSDKTAAASDTAAVAPAKKPAKKSAKAKKKAPAATASN